MKRAIVFVSIMVLLTGLLFSVWGPLVATDYKMVFHPELEPY